MTRTDELNAEIRNQAVRLYPKCAGLFELPLMVYTQIVADKAHITFENSKFFV